MLIATVLSICSGALLVLSFPAFNYSLLAWFAIVPFHLAIVGRNLKQSLLLSFICGIVFFFGIFQWGLEVSSYLFLHHFLFSLFMGIYIGLVGLLIRVIARRHCFTFSLFAAPFVWVTVEYFRSNIGFLSFPWALLAHSQHLHLSIIQIASIFGTYGVSFMVALFNSAMAATALVLLSRYKKNKSTSFPSVSKRGVIALMGSAFALLFISIFYGQLVIPDRNLGDGIKLSVVQGNIEQSKKWNPKYAGPIMKTYADLTTEASKNQPELIIWPEAATPRVISLDRRIYSQVKQIAMSSGAYILLGSSQHQKFKKKSGHQIKFRNSAFLIYPDSRKENQRYDKIRLLPFGEYLPLKDSVPWSYINIPDIRSFIAGTEFTVFQFQDFRFGVTICWENIFPDLVRQFVKNGAQFIVNITNEAWFKETAAPYQFLSMSVFRAVENRTYVVRCANTGISCFIDPSGRIIDRVKDATGKDLFVRGVLTGTIMPVDSKTIYTRFGDWFAWLCILCTAGFFLVAIFKKKPAV
jgi:apolipoprotein N-acyltransferase